MKPKLNKFNSLISLITISTLLVLFLFALPELLLSQVGRIFAIGWALIAIVVVLAHTHNLSRKQRQYIPNLIRKGQKSTTTTKIFRPMN